MTNRLEGELPLDLMLKMGDLSTTSVKHKICLTEVALIIQDLGDSEKKVRRIKRMLQAEGFINYD